MRSLMTGNEVKATDFKVEVYDIQSNERYLHAVVLQGQFFGCVLAKEHSYSTSLCHI